ncbi:DUF4214 domain-containing protein [Campylobacter sp. 46490-21]|uniref:DUF4214 domain-containing protein n=1 Tax=Campylobacter magnus TaxID=3026462 RepID=UPI0023623C7E|nr:DUF4214 domain-containing protein [Campylobacter magnus]MDD0847321.1 DUF4214 domain-containing protein [Campylobacter magnus]
MALNVTQVNQAFLGLLGRPATGAEAAKFAGQLDAATLAQTLLTDASFKNELSVETLSFKTVDLLNTDPAAFVESLYTALLGRASDAEGKAFWLSVAGATPNRADVVSQFIAAVQSQEGSADANAFATIQAEDKALASAWVESLYNNLAGRASDAEGLDFWTNAIVSFTMTPAQVAASFAAALALQGNTTEDGQNYLAKQGVADAFTASFKDFNALITANEKAEQLKNLVTMMNGVNKDSQVDQYTQEITKITDEYQKIAAVQFTSADDDNLGIDPETGESNLKGAANFTGTYNLTDPTKGTIQSSDSATGTEAYLTDTLTVNVTGYDKTNRADFNLSDLPSTSSVEKLVINNGAANVNGPVAGDFQYINVNGTGSFNISANTNNALKDVSLNSAASKDGEINIFTTDNALDSIKTGAGDDRLTLGTVSKSINTGAGNDTIVSADLGKNATADLGAGDDTFTGTLGEGAKLNGGAGNDTLNIGSVGKNASISAGTGDDTIKLQQGINDVDGKGNPISTVEIDGGVGKDVIDFTEPLAGASKDFTGIKSIKGVETIKVLDGIKLKASAISGQKIELDNNGNLILDAKDATSVDLSKLSLADAANVSLQIDNLKSNITLKKTDANSNSHIAETITLDKDAKGIKISNFEVADDVIKISGVDVSTEKLGTTAKVQVERNKIYNLTTDNNKQTVTKANIESDTLGIDLAKVAEGDVFYIARSLLNASGSSNNTVVYKVYVGKAVNGTSKIAKVDTLTTINTKDIDFAKNFVKADNYKEVIAPTPTPGADANSYTVDISNAQGTDPISIKTDNLKNGQTLTISGANVETKDVIVPSAKGQNINVAVETKVKSLTLGDANETIKFTNAANLPGTINAGAGNDTIDLSAIAANGNLTVNGGDGRDTLIISGDNTITSLTNVEVINISGTSINADALSENNASVLGAIALVNTNTKVNDVVLTVDASATKNPINLTKYVDGSAKGKSVALNISGVSTNVNLNKNDNIKETITLASGANVAINGIGSGDKLDLSAINASTYEINNGNADTKADITVKASADKYTLTVVSGGSISGATIDLGSGDNTINITATNGLSGATINAGDGKNTLIVSGANIDGATINTGAGDDKLQLGAPLGPDPVIAPTSVANANIDLGAGNDTLTVRGASIADATINLGAGNDRIIILSEKVDDLKGATIDGGEGRDTLVIYGDTTKVVSGDLTTGKSGFTIKSAEVLEIAGNNDVKVNASILNGQSLALTKGTGTGTLEIVADEQTINLSKLVKTTESGETALTALTLSGIGKDATVTLSKTAASIAETITLASGAANVNINGFATTSDKLKLAEGAAADTISSSTVLKDKVLVGTAINSVAKIIGDGGKVATELVSAFTNATAAFSSTGQKGYIAQVSGTKTSLYEITNNGTDQSKIDAGDSVKLIATFDSALASGDFIAMA